MLCLYILVYKTLCFLFEALRAVKLMDNLHNRLTFDLGKKSKIFYYSQKEDPKISRIAEFGGEMS